jgi:hypothetical protein
MMTIARAFYRTLAVLLLAVSLIALWGDTRAPRAPQHIEGR